jgi:hypothetical protein
MDLGPLKTKDALNLALETSPKALERIRKNDLEKAVCYKLLTALAVILWPSNLYSKRWNEP